MGLAFDERLSEFVAGISTERRSCRLPCFLNAFSLKQEQEKIPKCCAGCDISAHSFDQNYGISSSATAHVPAVVAEYPCGADGHFAGAFIEPFSFAVPVQATRDTTMRTRHKIQSISRLVIFPDVANILGVLGTYNVASFSPPRAKIGTMRSSTLKE